MTTRRTSGRSGSSSRAKSCTTTTTRSRPRRASRCAAHEVDMGWSAPESARVLRAREDSPRRVRRPSSSSRASAADLDELRAIIVNRMHVLRAYMQQSHAAGSASRSRGPRRQHELAAARGAQGADPPSADARRAFAQAPRGSSRRGIRASRRCCSSATSSGTSGKAPMSNERLLADFREWCARAEQSGIQGLQDFVAYLKSFRAMRDSALGLRIEPERKTRLSAGFFVSVARRRAT